MGINEGAAEFIVVKDLRIYLILGEAANVRENVAVGEGTNLAIDAGDIYADYDSRSHRISLHNRYKLIRPQLIRV